MPRSDFRSRRFQRSEAACALLLAAGLLAASGPARAQESGLRGTVTESPAQQERLLTTGQIRAATPDIQPPPAYTPSSLGAVPDEPDAAADGSEPTTPDDPFAIDTARTLRPRPAAARLQDEADSDSPATQETAATPVATDTGVDDTQPQAPNLRATPIDADARQSLDPGAERTGSIEGQQRRAQDDPFAPVGIRAGSFVLRPSLEQGITATSNANSSNNGSPAVLSETTLRLNAASDWSENSAVIDGYTTYRKTLSGEEIEDIEGRVEGTLNVDLSNDMRAIARMGYEIAPESASSPVVISGTVSQPIRQTLNGSLGLEKDLGKMRFGLTGAVVHDIYGDAELSSGGTLSQKDRDSTLYTAVLRGGYEISPALTPFIEIETGRRLYDQRVDNSGFERSATRLGTRAGVEVDLGEKLAGEFSAGWLREAIDDDRLEAVSGLSVNADLRWSPERGTMVGLSGTTQVEGTTTPGESGSVLYSGRLSLERQVRANLTANAALSADWRDYVGSDGHDLTLGAEAGLTWWLNRYLGLTSRARTEKLTSNLPGREETTNSIFVGLRLQR
jgi:hypothetical protein